MWGLGFRVNTVQWVGKSSGKENGSEMGSWHGTEDGK